MKFLKAYIGKTEKIKQIDNIVSKPVFYVSENEENETLTDAFIELDAPFKMITILTLWFLLYIYIYIYIAIIDQNEV